METRASYVLVGSFVLAMLAGIFVFTVWVAKVQFEESREPYLIYFTGSVTGLQVGSPVRYRGIPIGTVTDIRLDPDNVGRVRVAIEVQKGTPIKADSIAGLEQQGLTGWVFVQISGGTELAEKLQPEGGRIPVIPSRPSVLSTVVDAAPELLSRVLEVSNRLAELMSPSNVAAVSTTLANVSTMSASLESLAGELNRTTARIGPHLDATVVQARQTLAAVENSAKAVSTDGREALQALKQTTAQVSALIAENREPVRDFTHSGLYETTLLVSQLRDLSGQMSRLVARIENDPPGFLFGGNRQGVEARGR
jgi:phospholipid/cholesterol/gamma-HCH transport system substrate-binding protein